MTIDIEWKPLSKNKEAKSIIKCNVAKVSDDIFTDEWEDMVYCVYGGVCYLNSGGELNITYQKSILRDVETELVPGIPTVILINSTLNVRIGGMGVSGLVLIRYSVLEGMVTRLSNSTLDHVDIVSEYLHIENSKITDSDFTANNYVIVNSDVTGMHASTVDTLSLNNVHSNGISKTLSIRGTHELQSLNMDFKFRNYDNTVRLPSIEMGDVKTNAIVERRIDYGIFSGATDIPFVRCNSHDIIVKGHYIDGDKFILAVNLYCEKVKCEHYVMNGMELICRDMTVNPKIELTHDEYAKMIKKLARIATDNPRLEYYPDPSNSIVNNILTTLMLQIRSRINLYKQLILD